MFRQLMNFLKSPENPPVEDLRMSVAVLLLEAARQDDRFGPEERAAIKRLLMQKFALSEDECAQLLAAGEAAVADMVQLHPYTHAILEQMDRQQRIQLLEMMWEVVYADGVLDPDEDALMRSIGGLIYVDDIDRMEARKRVLARMGKEDPYETP